jgi:D-serine dehydratase
VGGSIKARGGIYEVLVHAEDLALRHGIIHPGDDMSALASPAARSLFSEHEVAVGSTGNLGLSIGIVSAALGFQSTAHMSADAKEWKKARLQSCGVRVVEQTGISARPSQRADRRRIAMRTPTLSMTRTLGICS